MGTTLLVPYNLIITNKLSFNIAIIVFIFYFFESLWVGGKPGNFSRRLLKNRPAGWQVLSEIYISYLIPQEVLKYPPGPAFSSKIICILPRIIALKSLYILIFAPVPALIPPNTSSFE